MFGTEWRKAPALASVTPEPEKHAPLALGPVRPEFPGSVTVVAASVRSRVRASGSPGGADVNSGRDGTADGPGGEVERRVVGALAARRGASSRSAGSPAELRCPAPRTYRTSNQMARATRPRANVTETGTMGTLTPRLIRNTIT